MARPAGRLLFFLFVLAGVALLVLLFGRFPRSTSEEMDQRSFKMHYLANSGCTGRLAASMAVDSRHRLWKIGFKPAGTSAAKVRLRTRVVSPFEVFLVDVKPAAEANELNGWFTLGDHSLSCLDEVSIEVLVWTYDFQENITRNVLLANETYRYQLRTDDLPSGNSPGNSPRNSPSIPARRWILRDADLANALRCSRTPDAPSWCKQIPDRLWDTYFASWYIPPPSTDLELMAFTGQAARVNLDAHRRVCFFGDSQMRHLFNAFVMATSEYAVTPVASAEKEVMPSAVHTYVEKRWAGLNLGEGSISCTDIVANMGQWPAGWPEGRPWSFREYELAVRGDLQEMVNISDQLGMEPRKLYWLSTNPHGYMDVHGRSMYGSDATEWRWDGVIDEYNAIARRAAEESEAVQYLDIAEIARPLSDLPYDGAHYAGIVGDEMAWALIGAIGQAPDHWSVSRSVSQSVGE